MFLHADNRRTDRHGEPNKCVLATFRCERAKESCYAVNCIDMSQGVQWRAPLLIGEPLTRLALVESTRIPSSMTRKPS
jgi:hypothetical protein